jgi:2-hydroxychromene-2-carboxylate isomerase
MSNRKVQPAPAYKDRIRANTDECVRGGDFGSPTISVGDDMYCGNHRLVLLEAALWWSRWADPCPRPPAQRTK